MNFLYNALSRLIPEMDFGSIDYAVIWIPFIFKNFSFDKNLFALEKGFVLINANFWRAYSDSE